MEYNSTIKQYYITLDDFTENTFYSSAELNLIFEGIDLEKVMKLSSRSIYRLIYSYYPGLKKQDHITYMQTLIETNANNEQTYLKNAMIEFVKGAIESGMDLNAYIDSPKDIYPITVYQELRNGNLLDKSEKINNAT